LLMDYYVHNVPGRLRVKTPTLKYTAGGAEDISDLFNHLGGIHRVTANPVTGSVVINYDPELVGSREILQALKENGHFEESTVFTDKDSQDRIISRTAQTVGKVLFGWAVGQALEDSGLAFLTALI
jgi:copper chaperone CopZ